MPRQLTIPTDDELEGLATQKMQRVHLHTYLSPAGRLEAREKMLLKIQFYSMRIDHALKTFRQAFHSIPANMQWVLEWGVNREIVSPRSTSFTSWSG